MAVKMKKTLFSIVMCIPMALCILVPDHFRAQDLRALYVELDSISATGDIPKEWKLVERTKTGEVIVQTPYVNGPYCRSMLDEKSFLGLIISPQTMWMSPPDALKNAQIVDSDSCSKGANLMRLTIARATR